MAGRALKVYSMTVMGRREWLEQLQAERHHRQVRVLVAASSKAKACEAFDVAGVPVTVRELTNYGGETGNEQDRATALADPGRVFYATLDGPSRREWHPAFRLRPKVEPYPPGDPEPPIVTGVHR